MTSKSASTLLPLSQDIYVEKLQYSNMILRYVSWQIWKTQHLIQLGQEGYLLNELNAGSQIHPKVNECPFNSFLLVLLLLQHEHVVVEELLQFLIGEVDAQLLKAIELPDIKKCNIFKVQQL